MSALYSSFSPLGFVKYQIELRTPENNGITKTLEGYCVLTPTLDEKTGMLISCDMNSIEKDRLEDLIKNLREEGKKIDLSESTNFVYFEVFKRYNYREVTPRDIVSDAIGEQEVENMMIGIIQTKSNEYKSFEQNHLLIPNPTHQASPIIN